MKKQILIALFFIAGTTSLIAQKAEVFNLSGTAINGYDPVAYFKEGKPVKGNEKLSYDWNNAKWYFVSSENLNVFSKSPEKYAPQYGGYCAYGMSEGHKAPTDPNAWTIVNGKLYLNYSLDVKQKWNKNQMERIDQADKNWPQLKDKE
ncbi:MAG TPA: YHS domain-containing (seleno)protein [Chitinophagaceae bacterium]|jgi:YHS domain-containing protein